MRGHICRPANRRRGGETRLQSRIGSRQRVIGSTPACSARDGRGPASASARLADPRSAPRAELEIGRVGISISTLCGRAVVGCAWDTSRLRLYARVAFFRLIGAILESRVRQTFARAQTLERRCRRRNARWRDACSGSFAPSSTRFGRAVPGASVRTPLRAPIAIVFEHSRRACAASHKRSEKPWRLRALPSIAMPSSFVRARRRRCPPPSGSADRPAPASARAPRRSLS